MSGVAPWSRFARWWCLLDTATHLIIIIIVAGDGFKVACLLAKFQTLSSVRGSLAPRGERRKRTPESQQEPSSAGRSGACGRNSESLFWSLYPLWGTFSRVFLVYLRVAGLGHGDTISVFTSTVQYGRMRPGYLDWPEGARPGLRMSESLGY